jgi:hypothetical protein
MFASATCHCHAPGSLQGEPSASAEAARTYEPAALQAFLEQLSAFDAAMNQVVVADGILAGEQQLELIPPVHNRPHLVRLDDNMQHVVSHMWWVCVACTAAAMPGQGQIMCSFLCMMCCVLFVVLQDCPKPTSCQLPARCSCGRAARLP